MKRRDRLDTFVPPRPSPGLMGALAPVNRVLCLAGTPGLRAIPGLNCIPGIRGLSDVVDIDLPRTDEDRLLMAVNRTTAAFITPNHPEFFTDWMLDKELSARIAPLMASWATHEVVNGMGALAQWFWLKNNLVAQIPGAGGAAGREYSVDWALQGHGVLLHPEGGVGWHADHVAPLFPGVVDMGMQAVAVAGQRGIDRPVYIAPVLWKLRFVRDEMRRLEREMRHVEHQLSIPPRGKDLAARIHHAYRSLLARDAATLGIASDPLQGYFDAQARLLRAIETRMRNLAAGRAEELPPPTTDAGADVQALLRPVERWLRNDGANAAEGKEVRRLVKIARRLLRLTPALYRSPQWTQEQVAENIKRLRCDYCFGGWRDTLHRFVPRPVGPRVAHIRAAQPLDLRVLCAGAGPADRVARSGLLLKLRDAMQSTLDALGDELAPLQQGPLLRNPFL